MMNVVLELDLSVELLYHVKAVWRLASYRKDPIHDMTIRLLNHRQI